MKTTAYRLLDKLNPNFRKKVDGFLSEVNKTEKIIFITESWRSEERQKELLKLGLSKVRHSNHQDGLAIDIGYFGQELYPTDGKKWRKVADIAKKWGIDWGYDLWSWDQPHFQDNGSPLLQTIEKVMNTRYSDILTQELKAANFTPLFEKHEGNNPLTEKETKELIDIAFARYDRRKAEKKQ